ncbi:hypothetical protein ACFU5O_31245 [Streptomyces sp. NPDC057445]|uniref:hypothetical protein n=1 Tax=Streptomyces sp. NPDC057445 TaxID=3346136 RepID=UPI0036B3D50C
MIRSSAPRCPDEVHALVGGLLTAPAPTAACAATVLCAFRGRNGERLTPVRTRDYGPVEWLLRAATNPTVPARERPAGRHLDRQVRR